MPHFTSAQSSLPKTRLAHNNSAFGRVQPTTENCESADTCVTINVRYLTNISTFQFREFETMKCKDFRPVLHFPKDVKLYQTCIKYFLSTFPFLLLHYRYLNSCEFLLKGLYLVLFLKFVVWWFMWQVFDVFIYKTLCVQCPTFAPDSKKKTFDCVACLTQ